MTQRIRQSPGFTIVELLIVIVVIGILAALVVTSFTSAQQQAKIAKVESDLNTMKKAMLAYKQTEGELPPTGDFCNHCGQTVPTPWNSVVNSLQSRGYLGNDRPITDPWGQNYAYDDNDCNSNPGQSHIWSLGPDGVKNTADDIYVRVSWGCLES